MKRFVKATLKCAGILVLIVLWFWSIGAAYYMSGGSRSSVSPIVAAGVLVVTAALMLRGRRYILWWVLGVWAIGCIWYFLEQPSNDRDWPPSVGRTPSAVITGDTVQVRNIRNFQYRSPEDFDVAYYDKVLDLRQLDSVHLAMCFWDGNTRIAHTMLSFGFGGKDYVCLSVETRPENGEAWGGLPGIYRQFEIIYVLGDERDLINLRTSYRKEDVYLYRLELPAAQIRQYFVRMLERVNALNQKPEFYDTLEYNCSSALTRMADELWPEQAPRRGIGGLLNGGTARTAYANQRIANTLPFEELKRRSYITPVGQRHRHAADFSKQIRAALPQ